MAATTSQPGGATAVADEKVDALVSATTAVDVSDAPGLLSRASTQSLSKARENTRKGINVVTLTAYMEKMKVKQRESERASEAAETGEAGGLDDAEALQMIKDSYREVTGREMPSHMTAEEGYAELRLLTIARWQGEEIDDESESAGTAKSPLDRLRAKVRVAKLQLLLFAPSERGAAPAVALADNDWTTELMDMLKASYREMTGRALPEGLSYSEAELELRKATIALWQQDAALESDAGGRVRAPSLWAHVLHGAEGGQLATASSPALPEDATPPAQPVLSAVPDTEAPAEFEDDDDDDDSTRSQSARVAFWPALLPSPTRVSGPKMRAMGHAHGRVRSSRLHAPSRAGARVCAARPEPARRIQTGKDVFRAGTGRRASPKMYEGWLVKKPPSQLLGQKERRRWFVLHEDGELCYYTKPDLEVQKGSLSIAGLGDQNVVRAT